MKIDRNTPKTQPLAGTQIKKVGSYTPEQLFKRVVLTNLLWEDSYYQKANEVQTQMEQLIPQLSQEFIDQTILQARHEEGLRHTPLFLALETNHDLLPEICTRPDMTIDALYLWKAKQGSLKPIPKSIKRNLAKCFDRYDNYQIAKYVRKRQDITLADVVRLTHPSPTEENKDALHNLVRNNLRAPETWEVRLSRKEDPRKVFTELISSGKLGGLAFLRNMRNIVNSGVERSVVREGLSRINSRFLTPMNFLMAYKYAPAYSKDIEEAMARSFAGYKIPGTTVIALDTSGSMRAPLSSKSEVTRLDVGFALLALSQYIFEDPILVLTAGSDRTLVGNHVVIPASGLGVINHANTCFSQLGYGGIFTAQLCEWLKDIKSDRLVVISDSQDIDYARGRRGLPDVGRYANKYIMDIAHHTHGVKTNHWSAEINGFSDNLFRFIKEFEEITQ